jgi:hypothetical protein
MVLVLKSVQMDNSVLPILENVSLVLIPIVVLAHLEPVVDLALTILITLFALVSIHVQKDIMVMTVLGNVILVPMNV